MTRLDHGRHCLMTGALSCWTTAKNLMKPGKQRPSTLPRVPSAISSYEEKSSAQGLRLAADPMAIKKRRGLLAAALLQRSR